MEKMYKRRYMEELRVKMGLETLEEGARPGHAYKCG